MLEPRLFFSSFLKMDSNHESRNKIVNTKGRTRQKTNQNDGGLVTGIFCFFYRKVVGSDFCGGEGGEMLGRRDHSSLDL